MGNNTNIPINLNPLKKHCKFCGKPIINIISPTTGMRKWQSYYKKQFCSNSCSMYFRCGTKPERRKHRAICKLRIAKKCDEKDLDFITVNGKEIRACKPCRDLWLPQAVVKSEEKKTEYQNHRIYDHKIIEREINSQQASR
jgi:hypothetical protein